MFLKFWFINLIKICISGYFTFAEIIHPPAGWMRGYFRPKISAHHYRFNKVVNKIWDKLVFCLYIEQRLLQSWAMGQITWVLHLYFFFFYSRPKLTKKKCQFSYSIEGDKYSQKQNINSAVTSQCYVWLMWTNSSGAGHKPTV